MARDDRRCLRDEFLSFDRLAVSRSRCRLPRQLDTTDEGNDMRMKCVRTPLLAMAAIVLHSACAELAGLPATPEGAECATGICSSDFECGFSATCWEKFADQGSAPEVAQCVSGLCVYSWPCAEGKQSEQVATVEGGINPATLSRNKERVAACEQFINPDVGPR